MAVLDVLGKLLLLSLIGLVAIDPEWGNLEGKAPVARAVTYPLLAFAVPIWWHLRGGRAGYPWIPDLMLTLTAFSDVLGNRLDLYDRVEWFDDGMHLVNAALVSAAVLLLTGHRSVGRAAFIQRAVAVGATASLGWEVFEYLAFVTRSREYPMAYVDTLGDLVLGWSGAVAAGVLVYLVSHKASEPRTQLTNRDLADPGPAHAIAPAAR